MKALAKTLSIIIVNYNAGDFLTKCLQSLDNVKKEVDFDVWIVDNASVDNSLTNAQKLFPNLNYIINKNNLGYGAANNLALKQIDSEYILLLNPDSEMQKDTLKRTIGYLNNHPEVGAATCKVEKEDGSIDWASHRGFPTPWAAFLYFILGNDSQYHLTNRPMDQIHEVDAIAGAFFLTKKIVLAKVGLFDEDYFLYAEDIDLCYRIKAVGYKIIYLPEVKIIHHKGISSGIKKHTQQISTAAIESRKKALDSFYQTMLIFYDKHYASKNLFIVNWLVHLGINSKWYLAKWQMNV